MKLMTLIAAVLVLGGCASTRFGAPQRSVASNECKSAADTRDGTDLTKCALDMHSAYSDRAVQLMNEGRTGFDLPLIGLAAIGAGTELYKGSRAITRGAGLLTGLFTGVKTYWKPKELADIYLSGADEMRCIAVEGNRLLEPLRPHSDQMNEMKHAYDSFEEIEKAYLKGAVAFFESSVWAAQAEALMDDVYAACAQTRSAAMVGGYDKHGDYSKAVHEIRLALFSAENAMLKKYNDQRGSIDAVTADIRKVLDAGKQGAEAAAKMADAAENAEKHCKTKLAEVEAARQAGNESPQQIAEEKAAKDLCKAAEAAKNMSPTNEKVEEALTGLATCNALTGT